MEDGAEPSFALKSFREDASCCAKLAPIGALSETSLVRGRDQRSAEDSRARRKASDATKAA